MYFIMERGTPRHASDNYMYISTRATTRYYIECVVPLASLRGVTPALRPPSTDLERERQKRGVSFGPAPSKKPKARPDWSRVERVSVPDAGEGEVDECPLPLALVRPSAVHHPRVVQHARAYARGLRAASGQPERAGGAMAPLAPAGQQAAARLGGRTRLACGRGEGWAGGRGVAVVAKSAGLRCLPAQCMRTESSPHQARVQSGA